MLLAQTNSFKAIKILNQINTMIRRVWLIKIEIVILEADARVGDIYNPFQTEPQVDKKHLIKSHEMKKEQSRVALHMMIPS